MIARQDRTPHQNGNRNTVIEDVRQAMLRSYGGVDIDRVPLQWSVEVIKRLDEAGHRAIIQAGTASWKMVDDHLDDGIAPNEWGYTFQDDGTETEQILMGIMPEMHVWVAIPDRSEIVDVMTGYQVERALEAGHRWRAPHPPDWLWCKTNDVAKCGAIYVPHRKAIKYANMMIRIQGIA